MKHTLRTLALLSSCALLEMSTPAASSQDLAEAPTYANVRVISVDQTARVIVIRNSKGRNERFPMDDLLATTDVKAGDRVMVTLRGETGQKRISSIMKVTGSSAPANSLPPAGPPVVAPRVPVVVQKAAPPADPAVRERFARRVASLSQDAGSIDARWTTFVTSCDVKSSANTGGRDWFGLWDGRVQADYSNGVCREMFNEIVNEGEGIKKGMVSALEGVQNTLKPGEIRDVLNLNRMNWGGWALPAPPRREP